MMMIMMVMMIVIRPYDQDRNGSFFARLIARA